MPIDPKDPAILAPALRGIYEGLDDPFKALEAYRNRQPQPQRGDINLPNQSGKIDPRLTGLKGAH